MSFTTESISKNTLISIVLFFLGILVNSIGYSSFHPTLVGFIFLSAILLILSIFKVSCKYELQAFIISFSISFFWAGVASIYANYFNDPGQNVLDAAYFYELASDNSEIEFNLLDSSASIENGGAIVIWKFFYNLFGFIGFEKNPYIGICVNISLIALTSVVGVRMVKHIHGYDIVRIKRFIKIFTLCPIFWYFASVHIRDAAVLFAVSALCLIWIIYITNSTKYNLVKLIFSTLIAFGVFGLLRTEFVFVPFAMVLCGILSGIIGKSEKKLKFLAIFLAVTGIAVGSLFASMQSNLLDNIENGNSSYNELSIEENGDSSLGNNLIVSAPVPIRLTFGSIYLFVFPIPMWSGFQLESVALLFKSLNAIFMYAITPLFTLTIWRIIKNKKLRTATNLFLLFLSLGFTLAVAYTSIETRHFAAFLLPILIVSLIPNLSKRDDSFTYSTIMKWFMILMITIHFAWFTIKFL